MTAPHGIPSTWDPNTSLPLSFWEERSGTMKAPWEIQRAQRDILRLADAGAFDGKTVLDVGTGIGDNAIAIAKRPGASVTAFDLVDRAVALARERAAAAGVQASFLQADALALGQAGSPLAGQAFDAVVDSSIFHIFGQADRKRYAGALATVSRPGAKLYVLVFSDKDDPRLPGPHRIRQQDFRDAFNAETGWEVESVVEAVEETFAPPDVTTVLERPAYLATVVRLAGAAAA